MSLPTITAAELQKHRSTKSCYVVLGSKVYDVTAFLPDHPGGDDLILDYAGQDIAEILADGISHEHSEAAYEILADNHIGFLAPEGRTDGSLPPSPPGTPSNLTLRGPQNEEELNVSTNVEEDYKTHKFLNLDQPLFMQIWRGNFSKAFYLEQVHKPRHYKGGESAPFFGNFLEPLSKTPWYVVPTIWLPCIAFGVYSANAGLPSWQTPLFFGLGLAIWTLVEYVLHRCLFHIDEKMPDHRISIILHFTLHGVHHYLPMDKLRLVMPPALFFVLAIPFWKLAHTIFAFNWYIATAVFCGGVFGYVCYDLTHYFLHHRSLPSYFRQLKKYHLQHHFTDYQRGFGVTSKLWDVVFGTELIFQPTNKSVKSL